MLPPARVQHWLASYGSSALCGVQSKKEADFFWQLRPNLFSSQVGPFLAEGPTEETTSCCTISWKHLGNLSLPRDVDTNNELGAVSMLFSVIYF